MKSKRLNCGARNSDTDEVWTFDPYEGEVLMLDLQKTKSKRLNYGARKCDADEV